MYMPQTEEKPEDEKKSFWMVKVYQQCPNDIKIILGDMNAKVGREGL